MFIFITASLGIKSHQVHQFPNTFRVGHNTSIMKYLGNSNRTIASLMLMKDSFYLL
uniref:DNA for the transposon-like element on the lactose plasmid n=1 Tax=Lactococcus lactis TaxID=1358 RepID=Q99397_9LACT|nr:unnamed protein product [Lactococcus lactis]